MNLPHPSLTVKDVAQGLLGFASGYPGRIYLEILLVRGQNDSPENLKLLREYCRSLQPDRVDVVTMTRPGASASATPVERETLERWRRELGAKALSPGAAEAIQHTGRKATAETNAGGDAAESAANTVEDAVRRSLRRRPQTAHQLTAGLGLSGELVENALETLSKQGHIRIIGPEERDEKKEPFFAILG